MWRQRSVQLRIQKNRSGEEIGGELPGGVLRYISDREVQSPFLGLKLAILDFF